MGRAGPHLEQGFEMISSSIPFIFVKIVIWKLLVEFFHDSISSDLGEDACSCDGEREGVAVHNGSLGFPKEWHKISVDESPVGRWVELIARSHHGFPCGFEDVDPINLVGIDQGDAPIHVAVGGKFEVNFLSRFFGELLGVVEGPMSKLTRQDDRHGYHRSCQGSSTDFIDSADAAGSLTPGFTLEAKEVLHNVKLEEKSNPVCFLDLDGALAEASAQIVELRTTDFAAMLDFDFVDAGRMEGEYALNTFAIGNPANGETSLDAGAAFAGNDNASENLDAFFFTFHDLGVDFDGISHGKGGYFFFKLLSADFGNDRIHGSG